MGQGEKGFFVLMVVMVLLFLVGVRLTDNDRGRARERDHEKAQQFPEPDAVYNSQGRTCMVYGVSGSQSQYWQCSDGCEYIGTWSVNTERRLVCPPAATNEEEKP